MLKFEKYLFYVLLLLALSIVIIPTYYITGDGASHTYNAKVLFDYVFNFERDFYKEFYTINRSIDPNWMSHLILGGLLQIFPMWLADKILQILYLVLFATGLRYLILSNEPKNGFLSFLFFPFLFNLPFQQGFYNYSLSLAFLFFTVGYYIRHKQHFDDTIHQLVLAILLLLTTFSHGMPAVYAMLILFLIWIFDYFHFLIPFHFKKIISELSKLLLIALPSLLLLFLFLAKKGFGTEPHAWSYSKKLIMFLQFWTSQSTRHAEMYPAMASGILLIVLFFILLFTRMKVNIHNRTSIGHVFLIMIVFSFFSYITCPHSIGGAGSIDIRLGFLPPLFLLLFFSTKNWSDLSKQLFISSAFIISISFLIIRFPYVLKANEIGKEIMTAGEHIEDKSVVLNLHFDDWQRIKNADDSLFQLDGSFIHFSDFIGAQKEKHLIMVMNYEAEINYFPVNWQAGKNPRESIAQLIPGNYPPCGDILSYEQQIHRKINYVLIQNWRKDFEKIECVQQLINQLNNHFVMIYQSKNKYVAVLKRKDV
ncbi:MAG TPA: hypothetical protein PKA54_01530 [Chitinophagaceae bacterium]|nr:MAG: hypothetical protein UZ11_BCD004000434 [Bacteroidetes bacterium OLB11]HMN32033.1 hypothetical protein [Chitinophagaceae bacterium]